MSRIWGHSHATGSQLLVLLAIADFADDHGKAWPSVPTLAKKARISERHTQRVIKQLKDMDELAVDKKKSSQWGTNFYRITLKPEGVTNCHQGGDVEVTRGVTFDTQRGDVEVTQTINKHHKNHSDVFSPNRFLELYASCAPNLPQPREVTNGRSKKILQRLKSHPTPEYWQEVFTKANQTPFLRGENDRGWRADLDWFVANDENSVKVFEGKYDRAAQEELSVAKFRDFDAERGARDGN